jgi:hypothetical protein
MLDSTCYCDFGISETKNRKTYRTYVVKKKKKKTYLEERRTFQLTILFHHSNARLMHIFIYLTFIHSAVQVGAVGTMNTCKIFYFRSSVFNIFA